MVDRAAGPGDGWWAGRLAFGTAVGAGAHHAADPHAAARLVGLWAECVHGVKHQWRMLGTGGCWVLGGSVGSLPACDGIW